jgi:predicted RNA binding protein YcfA (HicA-like mRNA interferase family)
LPDRKLVPVPYQTLVRIFEKDGFTLARQEGDHRIFTKDGVLRPLVIPTYRAVPVFIIRNPSPNLRYEPRKILRAHGGMIPGRASRQRGIKRRRPSGENARRFHRHATATKGERWP